MRDQGHLEHVERWARSVKPHPRSEWIRDIKPSIDSQITNANRFYARLAKTPGGREKLLRLRGHAKATDVQE